MSYNYIADLNLEMEIKPESTISQTLFKDDKIRVVLFGFAAGQELTEHTASRAASLHFLKGEAKLTLDGEERQAQSQTWVHMPPRMPHSVLAITDVLMLLTLYN
jgi:quercetin dioxygenase-like cupin family protein